MFKRIRCRILISLFLIRHYRNRNSRNANFISDHSIASNISNFKTKTRNHPRLDNASKLRAETSLISSDIWIFMRISVRARPTLTIADWTESRDDASQLSIYRRPRCIWNRKHHFIVWRMCVMGGGVGGEGRRRFPKCGSRAFVVLSRASLFLIRVSQCFLRWFPRFRLKCACRFLMYGNMVFFSVWKLLAKCFQNVCVSYAVVISEWIYRFCSAIFFLITNAFVFLFYIFLCS